MHPLFIALTNYTVRAKSFFYTALVKNKSIAYLNKVVSSWFLLFLLFLLYHRKFVTIAYR